MDSHEILISLVVIAVLGVAAQWLAWRLHLPSILLLLVFGLLAGPVAGVLEPSPLFGHLLHPLISLAVGVILFEGGLTLELSELRSIGGALLRLVSIGVLITWGLACLAAHFIAGLAWPLALILGAILTVTGPTVIGPLLLHIRPKGPSGPIAKWEGIVADVIGATLAVLVFHAVSEGVTLEGGAVSGTVMGLLETGTVGMVAGLIGALMLALPLRRHLIPDALQSPFVLGLVLGVYGIADHFAHEAGLLAVTLMGFVLANQKSTPIKHIVEFKENLRTLLISTLFIVLAANLQRDDLLGALSFGNIAFVIVLIAIVRPLAVYVSTLGTGLAKPDRIFLAFLAPRGVVAAAVAALFAAQLGDPEVMNGNPIPQAGELGSLTFLVIVGTVTFYGLGAAPLARRLGLAEATPQGVLLVGSGPLAQMIATALKKRGIAATIADTNRASVAEARLAGLTAVWTSALSEEAEHRLPLGGIGRMLALTQNDEVNSLAALRYTELFGRAEVYQLSPNVRPNQETAGDLRGRVLFAAHATAPYLIERMENGGRIRATTLTEEFDFEAYMFRRGARALPLFKLTQDGKLTLFTAQDPPITSPGDTLFALVEPSDADGSAPPGGSPTDSQAGA